jgi:hypothetical protein
LGGPAGDRSDKNIKNNQKAEGVSGWSPTGHSARVKPASLTAVFLWPAVNNFKFTALLATDKDRQAFFLN